MKTFLWLFGKKMLALAGTFLVTSLLLFLAIRAIPGDPVALRLKHPDPARVAEERARLGLDRPWPAQWARTAGDFIQGNWGESLVTGRPVREEVGEFFPATLELAGSALAIGLAMGTGWAFLAGLTGNRLAGATAHAIGMAGLTIPVFWIGLLLILVGSLWLGWFPPGGRGGPELSEANRSGFLLWDTLWLGNPALFAETLRYLALPVFCLSLFPAAQVCATLRARLDSPKVRGLVTGLRARGISPLRIWLIHIGKLVAAPVVMIAGTTFGILLGGAVLTETVFSWPGMGRYLVAAVLARDVHVIQNGLLLIMFLVLAVVQATDLLAAAVNPVVLRDHDD